MSLKWIDHDLIYLFSNSGYCIYSYINKGVLLLLYSIDANFIVGCII